MIQSLLQNAGFYPSKQVGGRCAIWGVCGAVLTIKTTNPKNRKRFQNELSFNMKVLIYRSSKSDAIDHLLIF